MSNEKALHSVNQSLAERENAPANHSRDTALANIKKNVIMRLDRKKAEIEQLNFNNQTQTQFSSNIQPKPEMNSLLSKPQRPNLSYANNVYRVEAHLSKIYAPDQVSAVTTKIRNYRPEMQEIGKSTLEKSFNKDSSQENKEAQTYKGLALGTHINKTLGTNFPRPRNKVELQGLWKGNTKVAHCKDSNQRNDRLKLYANYPATSVNRDYKTPNEPLKELRFSSDNKENISIKVKNPSFITPRPVINTEALKDTTTPYINQVSRETKKQTKEQSIDTVSSKYQSDTLKQKDLYQNDYKEPFRAKVSFVYHQTITLYSLKLPLTEIRSSTLSS